MGELQSLKTTGFDLWRKWPPGICIAVLAGAAAIFPIVTPSELTPRDKAKWTAGLGFLLVLELVIIFKERKSQDRAYIEQLKSIEEMRAMTDARLTSLLRMAAASNDPVEGLRKRSLQLSDSILEFIQNRMQGAPTDAPMPPMINTLISSTIQPYPYVNTFGQTLKYQQDTIAFYVARFATPVNAILREFAEQGIVDEWLNGILADIRGDWWIRMVGERLGALTELLNQTPV